MAPGDVIIAQLLAENRRLRQTVGFLNAQVDPRPEPTAPPDAEEAQGRPVEEAYRILVDASLQGLLLIQEERIVFANQKAAEIMGYTVRELLTTTLDQLLAFVHPEDRAMVRRRHEDRLQGRPSPSRYEFRTRRQDGRLRWIEIHAGLVEYRGRPATQIALLDITAHKQTEQTLRETESRLQDLAASIPGAVCQFQVRPDDSWEILFMNESAAELFEKPAGELTDMNRLVGCLCPEDVATLHASIEESRRTLLPWVCEFRIRTGSGRTKWLRGASRPRSSPDGSVLWNGVLLDVTEQKLAEEALRESEERFRRVFEESPVGMVLTGRDFQFLQANPAFCRMVGYTPQEMTGLTFLGVTHPEHRDTDRQNVEMLWRGEISSYRTEKRYVSKDGDIHWGSMSASILRDRAGTPCYSLAIIEDITERRRAQTFLEMQRDLAVALNVIDDLREGLCLCLQRAIRAAELDCGGVYLRDGSSGGMDLYCHLGLSEAFARQMSHYEREAVNVQLTMQGAPLYANYTQLGIPLTAVDRREGLQAIALVPIVHGEQVIGCVSVASHTLAEVPPYARIALETIAGQISDTIVRLRAQQALRESEARLASIFRAAPVGIGLAVQDIIKDVNQSILDMTGYCREELLERSGRVLYPNDEEFARVGHDKCGPIHQHGKGTVETKWQRKDGAIIDVLLSSTPLNPNDLAAGVTFTALDITERKRAEEELRAHRQELRRLASELTLAEEQERRRIAVDLHDHACQDLVLARMNLQPLLRGGGADRDILLQEIDCTLGNVLESVRDLTFDLSSPTLYRFGLEAALEDLLDDLRGKHGLACHFHQDGRVKPLADDVRVLLFRSVRELLLNVVKHARARTVTVDVRRQNGFIAITVTDDGVGCDVQEALSSPAHHRHLGLLSVRERLNYVGGRLEIRSAPGQGSQFTLLAPLERKARAVEGNQNGSQNSARG